MSLELPEIQAVIRAVDEFSGTLKQIESNTQASMGQVQSSMQSVEDSQTSLTDSTKGLVVGFSGVATSAFALYSSYDHLHYGQIMVDRANVMVKASAMAVDHAQDKYNATVKKFGVDSEQAIEAQKELSVAVERYGVVNERADWAQHNLQMSTMSFAMTVIPSAITMIDSVCRVSQSWEAIQTALDVVMDANPVMLVVIAITALVGILIYAYGASEPFRNAVNGIGAAFTNVLKPAIDTVTGALQWLWKNVVEPFTSALKPLTDGLGAIAGWFNNLGRGASEASGSVQGMSKDFKELYGIVGSPPSTGLIESFEALDVSMKNIKPPDLGMKAGIPSLGPNISLGGGSPSASVSLFLNGPLVNVEGSADKATVERAAAAALDKLKNVLVEASSAQAPGTHKRIRSGGTLNLG